MARTWVQAIMDVATSLTPLTTVLPPHAGSRTENHLGKMAAASSSAAAAVPLEAPPISDGSQATELAKRLFVLVAANRQSFPRKNSALACDSDTLLERLRQFEEFASSGASSLISSALKDPTQGPPFPSASPLSPFLWNPNSTLACCLLSRRDGAPAPGPAQGRE